MVKYALVENEYKKFSEINPDEVKKLINWLTQQPHLPKITELEIILFYHSCYCSVELTKQTIDTYFTFRTHVPEFFANRDILSRDMINAMNVIMYSPLPITTEQGNKVIYCKVIDSDSSRFIFNDACKLFLFAMDLFLIEAGTAEGYIILIDMDGVLLSHVARLGVMTIKKILFYLQEAFPVRLKGLHFMNTVPFMDKILLLMRPFLKKELLDVMQFHTNNETMFPYIPQEALPKEYGGKAETIDKLKTNFFNYMKENRAFFIDEEESRRVKENLRDGKPKSSGDLFGVEGNFKQLRFD